MNLESVGKLVARHSASPAAVQRRIDSADREQAAVRMMFNWMMWGAIILGIGVAMIVINKNFDIGKWFATLSSFLVLAGAGVGLAGVFKGIKLGSAPRSAELPRTEEPKTIDTNPIPPALPSVTEQTTQLIGVNEAPTNKMMDTGTRE